MYKAYVGVVGTGGVLDARITGRDSQIDEYSLVEENLNQNLLFDFQPSPQRLAADHAHTYYVGVDLL